MISKNTTIHCQKTSRQNPIYIKDHIDKNEVALDADVQKALESYQCAINRYNYADISDPRVENIFFLERQIAYIGLQLALAKARIREGMDPSLDYTSFESVLKLVGQCD